jgi:hypothetical protein
MARFATHSGLAWSWRLLGVGLALASALGAASAASGGGAGAAGPIAGTPTTATLVGTVNVADLAPPTSSQGSVLPLLVRDPAAYAAAKAAPQGLTVEGAGQESPAAATLTPGTKLTGAINGGNSQCGCTPPDMGLAVDPSGNKMEQVDLAGRVWNSGNNHGSIFGLAGFFKTGSDFISDPWVLYNGGADRWFAGIVDVTASSERLAVSTAGTPTTFKIYNVPQGQSGVCGDQGKLGVSKNVVALSTNVYTNFCNPGGSYLGDRVTVLNKAELAAGDPSIDGAVFPDNPSYFSLVPAKSLTTTSTQWYAEVNADTADVVKTTGTPPNTVTMSEPFTPSIRQVTIPPGAQQPGTGTRLDTGDSRTQNVVFQSGALIFGAATGCTPNGDITRSCLRLLDVDTSTGVKTIDQTFFSKGRYLFYPAVNVDGAGTIVLAYGRSSTSVFPELRALPVDSSGAAGASAKLVGGTAPNTTGRYGDYFAVANDPSSSTDLWVAGEIGGGSGGWNTGIRQVTVSP